jgi:uncharacterized protein (TIGR04222 family)
MRTSNALLVVLLLTAGATAEAKTYSAERYDSRIRVMTDGSLEVVETAVFRFEDGSFTYVFREIPTRRTDSIEIVGAAMDGRPLRFGTNAGEVEIRDRSPIHVRWHFAPRSGSSHTFELTYVVRGVVQKSAGGDLLEWVALPAKHDYRIDSADVIIDAPAPFAAAPVFESRRVDTSSVESGRERVQIQSRGIGKNGWIKTRLYFADFSVIASAPQWQQRRLAADALAPRWVTAALLIFVSGLVVFFGMRQDYDSPAYVSGQTHSIDAPPDALRPALAGAVASNGGISLQHAMSTMFTLADRRVITITEEPRKWGQRQFAIHRQQRQRPAAPEESALLSVAFTHKGQEETAVPLDKARGRVAKELRRFKQAVRQELRNLGLWHDDRARVRTRYLTASFVFLIAAGILIVPAAIMSDRFSGWGLLPAAALGGLAIVGFTIYGALTPLTNEGLKRSEAWRAYQKHLKDVAREKAQLALASPSELLPFAVALGLAAGWSKFIKHHPADVPPWFRTMTADAGAFPAFVAAGGGEGVSGGAGGAGGAAGGGSSGAG